jgi:hypothetical protein
MPNMAATGCVIDSVDENNVEAEVEAIGMKTAAVLPRLRFTRSTSA